MKPKHLLIIYIIIGVLGLLPFASAQYYWTGQLHVGQGVYINGMYIMIDRDRLDNRTAAVIHYNGDVRLLFSNDNAEIAGIKIDVVEFNDYMIVSLSSEHAFTVQFENATAKAQVANLTKENEQLTKQVQQLKAENEKLKQQLRVKVNPAKLHAQISNLTKENRGLKAQLNNQTKRINKLLAENEFLKQQIEEYRGLLTKVMETESSKNKKSYIEQAAKKEKWGKVLLGALATGAVFAGVVIYLGKRAEARYKRLV